MSTIKVEEVLGGDLLEDAYRTYVEAFTAINEECVQRHLMERDEFDAVARNPRIRKYVAIADGRVVGLSTFTNSITVDDTPLLSRPYFAKRWPERLAQGRIWYIGFVGVCPTFWGGTVFADLITAMWEHIDGTGAVAVYDMSRLNTDRRKLPQRVSRLLRRLDSEVSIECADVQGYWFNKYPEPTPV
jgi:hypothetical protein